VAGRPPTPATGAAASTELEAVVAAAFERFGGADAILLAVSGGPDSTALMHLAARWAQRSGRSGRLHVATIDHGLRPGSRAETDGVAAAAASLGLPHARRTWTGPHPETGRPAAARAARYRLLTAMADGLRPQAAATVAVVTGHTADDQAETLLMRLARGSGPDGLAAMRPTRPLAPGLTLHRPLLGVPKAALLDWLRAERIAWIEDPTNADLEQERPRWRAAKSWLDRLGLTSTALTIAARRQAEAVATLDAAVAAWPGRAAAVNHSTVGEITIERSWLAGLPVGLRQRLLLRAIGAVGGQSDPVPLAAFEAQAHRLEAPLAVAGPGRQGFTLHGAEIDFDGDPIRVRREALDARVPLHALPATVAALPLQPGGRMVWDHRFRLSLAATAPAAVRIGPLTADGLARVLRAGGAGPAGHPLRALWTSPVLRDDDGAIMVAPALGYAHAPWQVQHVQVEPIDGWLRIEGLAASVL
jgi:tRNA(Ile)-lysidine synthase